MSAESFGVLEAKPRGMDDPDYARFFTQARIIAWQFGFALIHHGTLTRDLDLVMLPWEERASDKIVPAVINRIAQVTETSLKGEPGDKPHGRKAYTLFLPDMVRWVDLSVVPCRAGGAALAAAAAFLAAHDAECALLEGQSIGRDVSDAAYFEAASRTSEAAHAFRAAIAGSAT